MHAVLRVAPAGYLITARRDGFAQTLAQQHKAQAANHLHHRQQRGAAGVIVVTERLVNCQFDGGGLRATAE